jgi:antirestriction protein
MEQQPQDFNAEGINLLSEALPGHAGLQSPRIYVASLSDYNAGRLHGIWVSAAETAEELSESVQEMLRSSPFPGAEEFAIHDYEGFGPLRLDEYETLETVAYLAGGIAQYGPAFAHWAAHVGHHDQTALDRFEDAYRGHYPSVHDYAETLLEDIGILDELAEAVPEPMAGYVEFDFEGFARDMELSGEITTSEGDGGVYVFDGLA